ncbi:hypothetical protein [Streptomyces beihaiensis]|uniref:Serine/threonine protein kinase n=1 Tax=Streptomyces beihaiensis TaxID=2984495 RepID=A0ABT3U310_9ACTN|nr:hypothetical protein [Streptomyces beihaiensis]MCX3063701.1 hypothetical protein [Streptomyces beihaiensis]
MAPSPDDFDQPFPPAGSPQARDHGLRRSRRLTRWVAAGAVAATAALGGLYTHLLPGSSASPAPSAPSGRSTPASSTSTGGDDGEGGSDDGAGSSTRNAPQAPAQPPASTQQTPQTTTGAS